MEKIIEDAKAIKAQLNLDDAGIIEIRINSFDEPVDVQLRDLELPGMEPEVHDGHFHLRVVRDGVRYTTVISPWHERYSYWQGVAEANNDKQ